MAEVVAKRARDGHGVQSGARVRGALAATSGIHISHDVLKMLMPGASVTMLCPVLMKRGNDGIRTIEKVVRAWMEEHEYESVTRMRGTMSQKNVENPGAFERARYFRLVSSMKVA
jgi:dihydroorotate dehydrogenase (fumarate)